MPKSIQTTTTVNTDHLQPPVHPNRTVIDVSEPDDTEVVIIPSIELSDVACSLESILHTLENLSDIFKQIEEGGIKDVRATSHLLHYSMNYMANLTHDNLMAMKTAIKQSVYGEGA